MAGILNGLGKFAEGLATGYGKAMKDRREQEVHDAQMQKVRDDQAMTQEIKKLSETKAAATDAYTVVDGEGNKTVYADATQAHDAAALNPGAQVQRKIMVAGKQFDTPEDASAAVEAANSPLAKTRMAAQIALKYNRPDVYDAHMKAYQIGVKANRDDMAQSFYDAQATGNLGKLAQVYNDRLPNGLQAKFEPQADGTIVMQTLKGDKPAGPPQTFKDAADLWAKGEAYVMKTPENALEVWKHSSSLQRQDVGLELQRKSVDAQGRQIDANVAATNASVAEMPERLDIARRGVAAQTMGAQASMVGAGASAANAETTRMGLTMPQFKEGLDKDGNLGYTAVTPVLDSRTKTWSASALPVAGGTGLKMKPKPIDPITAGMMGGGAGLLPGGLGNATPAPLTGEALTEAIKKALPPKTPAPRPIGGGIATTFSPAK